MFGFLDWIFGALAGLNPAALALTACLFVVAETSMLIGLFVPGDAVVLLAGSTISSPARFAALVAICTLGCLAGESLGYLLGRRFGPRVRHSRPGRRLGAGAWARAENHLRQGGGPAIFGSRFVAVIHALVPVVAGTVRMPYRRFITWAAAAAVTWSSLYVAAGAAVGASYRKYDDRFSLAGVTLLGMIVGGVLLVRCLRRHRRRTRSAADPPATRCDRPRPHRHDGTVDETTPSQHERHARDPRYERAA